MRPSDVTAARVMMKEGISSVRDIAKRMGMSSTMLYRYAGKRGSGVPGKAAARRSAGRPSPMIVAVAPARPRPHRNHRPCGRGSWQVDLDPVPGAARAEPDPAGASIRSCATRVAPQAEMELYAGTVAALKIRLTDKKGRHVSIARAIEFPETDGVETPGGLVK